jgi:G3E family GTPase
VNRLREITGGCVCCSSQAELLRALAELSETTPRPGRILVETSGAASPAGVIRALGARRSREQLQLDGVITVLDVTRARQALGFDIAVEQLGFADIVVLSHVDEAVPRNVDVDSVQEQLVRYAPAAVFARAQRGTVTTSLLELLEQRAETLHLHDMPQGSAHASIEAVSLVLDGELDEERFGEWVEDALASVEARILRIKGILAMSGVDERVIVQGVSEAVDVQLGSRWGDSERTSRLVVLGLGLDAAELEAGFLRCAAHSSMADTSS